MHRSLALSLCLSLAATLVVSGCAPSRPGPRRVDRHVTVVDVRRDPPTAVVEADPPPQANLVWARGYWRWDGHDYVAVPGHWERVRPGYHYVHAYWEKREGAWLLHNGIWMKD
jgi:hypothetical protein